MSDWETLLYDAQQDYWTLIDRINDRDPTLCNDNWKEVTIDFDMPYIDGVYQNINVEDMIDVVTDLIFNEYRSLYLEGKLDKTKENLGLVEFKNKLDGFANKRRELLVAKREEKETREEYLKLLKGKKKKKLNSYVVSAWGQLNTDNTGNAGDDTDGDVDSDIYWRKRTKDFDLDVIKSFLENHGKTIQGKMAIVQSIYDAAANTSNLSRLPYSVDKLLSDYRKNRIIVLKDIIDAFDKPYDKIFNTFLSLKNRMSDEEDVLNLKGKNKEAVIRQKTGESVYEIYKADAIANEASDGETESEDDESLTVPDNLTDEFKTPKAKQIMQKLVEAGWLNPDWQPMGLSIAERGYLAGEIADRLEIDAKWKVMGQMWNANPETLRQANIKASNQKKTLKFIEKIKKILG